MAGDPRRPLAYAGLYFFWGTTFLAIRIAVRHVPPFMLSGLRHTAAGLAFLAYARARGVAWPQRRELLGAAAMGVAFLGFANGICTWAMQFVESGYATLIIGGVPLVALAYSALVHGQKVSGREWGLVLLGLAGVAVLLSPKAISAHATGLGGILALCAATVVWASTMAEKKRIPQPADFLMSTASQMLGGGLVLLLASLGLEEPWALDLGSLPAEAWWAWAYLIVLGSCVGYGSFSWLLGVDPPALVGTYAYVNPVVAVLMGHWILGEALSGAILLSGLLIVASVAGLLAMKRS